MGEVATHYLCTHTKKKTRKLTRFFEQKVQHKMSQIISAEFELRRQMCEVQNAVRFYKHQRKCCHSPREIQLLLKNPGSHLNELFQSYGT